MTAVADRPRNAAGAARSTERTRPRSTSDLDGGAAQWCGLDAHRRATGQDQRDDLDV